MMNVSSKNEEEKIVNSLVYKNNLEIVFFLKRKELVILILQDGLN